MPGSKPIKLGILKVSVNIQIYKCYNSKTYNQCQFYFCLYVLCVKSYWGLEKKY